MEFREIEAIEKLDESQYNKFLINKFDNKNKYIKAYALLSKRDYMLR